MSFAVQAERISKSQTADDGLLSFNCPRCGKTILRYHPSIRGKTQLRCPRTGMIGRGESRGEKCGWKDYVYFNTLEEF